LFHLANRGGTIWCEMDIQPCVWEKRQPGFTVDRRNDLL
jgi:hypothetical protein